MKPTHLIRDLCCPYSDPRYKVPLFRSEGTESPTKIYMQRTHSDPLHQGKNSPHKREISSLVTGVANPPNTSCSALVAKGAEWKVINKPQVALVAGQLLHSDAGRFLPNAGQIAPGVSNMCRAGPIPAYGRPLFMSNMDSNIILNQARQIIEPWVNKEMQENPSSKVIPIILAVPFMVAPTIGSIPPAIGPRRPMPRPIPPPIHSSNMSLNESTIQLASDAVENIDFDGAHNTWMEGSGIRADNNPHAPIVQIKELTRVGIHNMFEDTRKSTLPIGMCLHPDGETLLVADEQNNRILSYNLLSMPPPHLPCFLLSYQDFLADSRI